MPIKVRCGNCERTIVAPDTARGKAVRCPDCKSPVRIPARTKKKTTAPAADDASSDAGFFSGLDLSQAEDTRARLCPKCAAQVAPELNDCPVCFTNLATGVVNARIAKRMGRKGPNPAMFYSGVWKDSFRFMLGNQRLALQTWLVLCLVTALHLGMVWGSYYIITSYPMQGNPNAVQDPSEKSTIRSLPEIMASQDGFWFHRVLAFTLHMIVVGWIWQMTVEVIKATQAKKSLVRRLNFAFLDAGAFGIKSLVWLVVYLLPALCIAAPILAIAGGVVAGVGGGGTGVMVVALAVLIPIACILLVTMPVAMVHMAQGHTYKAWSLPLMIFSSCKNIPAILYLCLVALVACLIPAGVFGGGIGAQLAVTKAAGPPHELLYTLPDLYTVQSGGAVTPALMEKLAFPWNGVLIWLGTIVIAGPFISYAIVFIIRALGLMGYYFQRRLNLINRTKPDQLCGFWARYAAYLVDCILVATIGCIFEPIELWKRNSFGKLTTLAMAAIFMGYFQLFEPWTLSVLAFYVTMFPIIQITYYARMESSKEQATLGKEAVGIKVTGLNGERLTFQQALLRTLLKQLMGLTFGLGFVLAGFTKQKQALHDMLCKTLVVFQGDLDRDL